MTAKRVPRVRVVMVSSIEPRGAGVPSVLTDDPWPMSGTQLTVPSVSPPCGVSCPVVVLTGKFSAQKLRTDPDLRACAAVVGLR